jgi:hypothetical protein
VIRPRWVRGARAGAHPERGQSTVELALVLPMLVLFLFALVQVALVARDKVLVVHAARVAAREASVDAGADRVRAAATHTLAGARVDVRRQGKVGDPVEVEVTYVSKTRLPLVGPLVPDVTLHSTVVMRIER